MEDKTKKLMFYLSADLHRRLRLMSAYRGETMSRLARRALAAIVEIHEEEVARDMVVEQALDELEVPS